MNDGKTGWSGTISGRLTLPTAVAFALVGLGIIALIHREMRVRALEEADEKAALLLNHNLAIHAYFNQRLKPSLFALDDSISGHMPFDPVWMSSTFAVREIDGGLRTLGDSTYYYKECAIGARNPANEADSIERAFLGQLNRDPSLMERSLIRTLSGAPYYTVLRRGEVMEEACMQCHSTPDRAPTGLVERYGPTRSFTRHVGEVVSAVSIRIPLGVAYASARETTTKLTGILIIILAGIFGVHFWLSRNFIARPLRELRDRVQAVADSPELLGTEVHPSSSSTMELRDLAGSFNGMSRALRAGLDELEDRVAERTRDLTEALANVRTLAGLLPICSRCKKIRNDQGFWQQVEAYVADNSDAEFTHGICPECAQHLYPEYLGDPRDEG